MKQEFIAQFTYKENTDDIVGYIKFVDDEDDLIRQSWDALKKEKGENIISPRLVSIKTYSDFMAEPKIDVQKNAAYFNKETFDFENPGKFATFMLDVIREYELKSKACGFDDIDKRILLAARMNLAIVLENVIK